MTEIYDKFIPLYEEIMKSVKIHTTTVINLKDILGMAKNLGIKVDADSGELFYFGLYTYFRSFKILISEGVSNEKDVIIFNKMSEEYEKFLTKIEDIIWILTADIINITGGIILKPELYARDEIAKAIGKFEELDKVILNLQLYIDGFEISELLHEAFRLMDRYRNSLAAILYKKFGKLSEEETKEYLEDTRQMIEFRFMPVTQTVEFIKGQKITLVKQSNLEIIATDLKNILASL